MQRKSLISTIFLIVLTFGMPQISWAHTESKPSNWHQYYQPIDDLQAQSALNEGLAYMKDILGEPSQPIEKIQLRLSEPIHPSLKIKRKFQLTEITDFEKGIYTIYLSQTPSKSRLAFYGQLGHELGHLFDARIHDAYFEGMCTLMSEKYMSKKGIEWERWLKYFESGHEPFYGHTYFMMKEIMETVGENAMTNFHQYIIEDPKGSGKFHINISDWIITLPKNHQKQVKQIIHQYAPAIQETLLGKSDPVAFMLPE